MLGSEKIKLIVFDLDGVLVSTKDMHYVALNKALESIDEKYIISMEDHIDKYDGLPTMAKLEMLHTTRGLPKHLFPLIYERKQHNTTVAIAETIKVNDRLKLVLKRLKGDGFKLFVASNAIELTVRSLLKYSGLLEYINYYISNEEVHNPKPNPEMYLRCMAHAGVSPDETLIVEDSPKGILAAQRSRANLLVVENPDSVTYEKIIKQTMKGIPKPKLEIQNLNILIPMAGLGSRFEQAGYTFPKPLIDVLGKPMIQMVVDNLGFDAHYIFIVRRSHYLKYNLANLLNLIAPNCTIIQVDYLTRGAACTTLLAESYINNEHQLIIANSDQFMEWNPTEFYYKMSETRADGGVVTFESVHPKFSYVKLDEKENVVEVAEKNPISNRATTGVYWYKKGSDYVKYAEQMITKNLTVNNEFYVAPVFNEYIADGKKIKTFNVDKMWCLGTPEDHTYFVNNYGK